MSNERIDLLAAVGRMARDVGSKYRNDQAGRDALWQFLDVNHWFGIEHGTDGQKMWITSIGPINSALKLWLQAYRRSNEEKIDLMLETYSVSLPKTCRQFQDYIEEKKCKSKEAIVDLLDFLLYSLDREIDEYDAAGLHSLVLHANQTLNLTSLNQLTEFLNFAGKEMWIYQFPGRRIVKPTNSAYTLQQFSTMAYTVFNADSWRDNDLIRKAAESERYANLWLFIALHFVCAIRKSDLARLPAPSLPYPPQELRGKILAGTFSRREARSISEELMFRLDMKPLKPGKTKRYHAPDMKLFVPESILEPLGIILALSLSFREPGSPFLQLRGFTFSDMRNFFGEAFGNAIENRRFLSRRANKAYLQGIEICADETRNRPKGYMLAALARSHIGGLGKFPEITEAYLKDAAFSGYSPDFILREMFERGIFGFVPALLLDYYSGSSYRKLDVASQTQLIKMIGLNALQLESITESVMKSYQQARKIVEALLTAQHENRPALGTVLQNIASEAAPSRQKEFLCLRSAAGYPCCELDRSGCLGCRYEVYTKGSMHLLMKEYARLMQEQKRTDGTSQRRIKNILEKGILPAVSEILVSIPLLFSDAEMEPLYEIMERGIRYADSAES